MKSKHHYFAIALILIGVFAVMEVVKAISAGVSDVESLITAPWTAAKDVWNTLTSWIGNIGSAPAPGVIAATGQTAAATVGVADSSGLGVMLNSEAPYDNAVVAGLPVVDNGGDSGVVGVLGQLAMSIFIKFFLTAVLVGMIFIPGLGELLALPVLAALGYIWGFAPTK